MVHGRRAELGFRDFPGPIVSGAKLRDALRVHVESDNVELAGQGDG